MGILPPWLLLVFKVTFPISVSSGGTIGVISDKKAKLYFLNRKYNLVGYLALPRMRVMRWRNRSFCRMVLLSLDVHFVLLRFLSCILKLKRLKGNILMMPYQNCLVTHSLGLKSHFHPSPNLKTSLSKMMKKHLQFIMKTRWILLGKQYMKSHFRICSFMPRCFFLKGRISSQPELLVVRKLMMARYLVTMIQILFSIPLSMMSSFLTELSNSMRLIL